jgi:hypothetical protein
LNGTLNTISCALAKGIQKTDHHPEKGTDQPSHTNTPPVPPKDRHRSDHEEGRHERNPGHTVRDVHKRIDRYLQAFETGAIDPDA